MIIPIVHNEIFLITSSSSEGVSIAPMRRSSKPESREKVTPGVEEPQRLRDTEKAQRGNRKAGEGVLTTPLVLLCPFSVSLSLCGSCLSGCSYEPRSRAPRRTSTRSSSRLTGYARILAFSALSPNPSDLRSALRKGRRNERSDRRRARPQGLVGAHEA